MGAYANFTWFSCVLPVEAIACVLESQMPNHQIRAGLIVFGLAGLCVLLALFWSPMWITSVVLWGGAAGFTWVGARTMLGKIKAVRAQDPQQPPFPGAARPGASIQEPAGQSWPQGTVANPAPPGQSRQQWTFAKPSPPPHPGVAPMDGLPPRTEPHALPGQAEQAAFEAAVLESAKRVAHGMRRALIVLSLVVLVPLILLLAVGAVVSFFRGDFFTGAGMGGVCAYVVWYCRGPLRKWREWAPFVERD
ncbi:hypothetical protein Ssi03_39070 [Sphaerisporangium siamense]|uniref:Uncharacterized protein n=1 Tax=Sphaerisporangium siamense TaxID=795645 RepID=A0A7W7D622_9ACTN|nr:hypothetical protein [Sphaerisporangium siamense]MBB4700937.1 hypothetical protein [Sphaerisporangium siamense]GII85917.1 hypothetical protein Ssi03_39070 [Sphaerisporangium siamense]